MSLSNVNAQLNDSFNSSEVAPMNTRTSTRPAVLNQSISGYKVYFGGKNAKFGNDVEAARAYVKACNAGINVAPTPKPVDAYQNADGSPTARAQVEILDAENKDLREQLAMAKALNAKMADPKDFSALASDLRSALLTFGHARKGSNPYKEAVMAMNVVACTLSNNA